MKIVIEIPVATDERLNATERLMFNQYLKKCVAEALKREFVGDVRMFKTVCRFRYLDAKVTIEPDPMP